MQIIHLNPNDIHISERQRTRANPKYTSILDSIRKHGVLNPILVQRNGDGYQLVAGHTRLLVCKELSISVPCHVADDNLGPDSIEFVENYSRADLDWQDQCRAVAAIHRKLCADDPEWTQAKTAIYLCADPSLVSRILTVYEQLEEDPVIASMKSVGAAYKEITSRNRLEVETAVTSIILGEDFQSVLEEPTDDFVEAVAEIKKNTDPVGPLQCADFFEWQEVYDGPKFNVIHCDFPYGRVDVTGQGARWSRYTDVPDIYFKLLDGILTCPHIEQDAVVFCWLDMKHFCATNAALKHNGWEPTTWPHILHKCNRSGFMPGRYGGRRTYEVMHYATRGEPPILDKRSLIGSYPVDDNPLLGHAEKPVDYLIDKMAMFVGKHSRFLDPTCGSGTAVDAALQLGAPLALGLDKNSNLVQWANARILMKGNVKPKVEVE